jgi:hypothetical protein
MPLLPGKSNIGHNISEMEASGHPHNQAVAAALREAGVPKKPSFHHKVKEKGYAAKRPS